MTYIILYQRSTIRLVEKRVYFLHLMTTVQISKKRSTRKDQHTIFTVKSIKILSRFLRCPISPLLFHSNFREAVYLKREKIPLKIILPLSDSKRTEGGGSSQKYRKMGELGTQIWNSNFETNDNYFLPLLVSMVPTHVSIKYSTTLQFSIILRNPFFKKKK